MAIFDHDPASRPDRFEIATLRFLAARSDSADPLMAREIICAAGLGATRKLISMNRIHMVEPMLKKGWIEIVGWENRIATYRLTAAGRAALARSE